MDKIMVRLKAWPSWSTLVKPFLSGLLDSLNLSAVIFCAQNDRLVRKRLWQCILFNILVCIPGILVDSLFAPHLKTVLLLTHDDNTQQAGSTTSWLRALFSTYYTALYVLYQLTLVHPFLIIALIFNTIWYQQISDAVTSLLASSELSGAHPSHDVGDAVAQAPSHDSARYGATIEANRSGGHGLASIIRSVRDELYRALVVGAFILQHSLLAWVLGWVPTALFAPKSIGALIFSAFAAILVLGQLAALYAYYAFEYRWIAESWPLESRFQHVEYRLPYFVGFGLLFSMGVQTLPGLWSTAFFGFGLPFLVVIAAAAPTRNLVDPESKLKARFPLFGPARTLNHFVLPLLGRYLQTRPSPISQNK